MKHCSNCGRSIADGAHFCPYCGTALPAGSEPPAKRQLAVEEQLQTIGARNGAQAGAWNGTQAGARNGAQAGARNGQGPWTAGYDQGGLRQSPIPPRAIPNKTAPMGSRPDDGRAFGSAPTPIYTYQNVQADLYAERMAGLRGTFNSMRIVNIVASVFTIVSLLLPWKTIFGEDFAFGDTVDSPSMFFTILILSIAMLICAINSRPALSSILCIALAMLAPIFLAASGTYFLLLQKGVGFYVFLLSCLVVLIGSTIQRFQLGKMELLEKEGRAR